MRALASIYLVALGSLFAVPDSASALAPTNELWSEEAQLLPPGSSERFGYSAAIYGGTLLIGAPAENGYQGAAYVYVDSGSGWTLEARLVPSDPEDSSGFGHAVAIEGPIALVGRPYCGTTNGLVGAVYVFVRSGGVWTQTAKLEPPDGAACDRFGWSIAIDTGRALIGAPINDPTGYAEGAVYSFADSGSGFTYDQKLVGSQLTNYSRFGHSISLGGDTALIGAPEDLNSSAVPGSAYIFERSGGIWQEQARLQAADASGFDDFGCSVALDSNTAVVGAKQKDTLGERAGAAYVFQGAGPSWSPTQKLVAADTVAFDHFGTMVAVEGGTALVSSVPYWVAHPGTLYVFEQVGSTWLEVERHAKPGDSLFGYGLALRGAVAVAGASLTGAGEAFVYARTPESGFGYCFGDPGSGTPCPCSNDNDGSMPGSGCDNGAFASGAHLVAYGTPSVAQDEIFLRTVHAEPFNSGLYFQGSLRVNGGDGVVFGDGLRCAGGQVKRLQVTVSDEDGITETTVSIVQKGEVSPGDIRWYQYWYRTTHNPPCGLWVNEFNLSNAFSITWVP